MDAAVRLHGNQFFVFLIGLAVLHAQHGRLAGTVQIGIQHTHTRTHPRHGHRQVGGGGGFAHAALARGHGDDIFHAFNRCHAGLHFVRGDFGGDFDMQRQGIACGRQGRLNTLGQPVPQMRGRKTER